MRPIGIFDSGIGGLTVARAIADFWTNPKSATRTTITRAIGFVGPVPKVRHALVVRVIADF